MDGKLKEEFDRMWPEKDCPECVTLRADLETAKASIKWYVDYANGKDRDMCAEMERANKAAAVISRAGDWHGIADQMDSGDGIDDMAKRVSAWILEGK